MWTAAEQGSLSAQEVGAGRGCVLGGMVSVREA